jgi:hypothetical protein
MEPLSKISKVRLRWFTTPPTRVPATFATPARFEHQGDDWRDNAWSLVIETQEAPDADSQQEAVARFALPNAPHSWLSPGRRFTLFEGDAPMAEGVVEQFWAVKPVKQ